MNDHNNSLVRLQARLQGRVQGVGFRYFVQRKAQELAATGWVRNRWDGSVEVVAEASRPRLDQLLAALRRGPAGAHVTDLQFNWSTATGEFSAFSIHLTA